MSNKSSVQLHVTFDFGYKHGDIFTYVGIPRIFFNIFMITFGKILYVLDVHAKKDYLFYSYWASLLIYIVKDA